MTRKLRALYIRVWRFLRVRKGWTPGVPPARCPDCDEEGSMTPAAFHTGDGWWLHWYCDECGTSDESTPEISWPMKKDRATVEDLGRLGFRGRMMKGKRMLLIDAVRAHPDIDEMSDADLALAVCDELWAGLTLGTRAERMLNVVIDRLMKGEPLTDSDPPDDDSTRLPPLTH